MSIGKKIKKLFRTERQPPPPPPPPPKIDCFSQWSFIREQPFGQRFDQTSDVPGNTINWVIPDVSLGGGGHLNIFRMVANLEKLGWVCRIIIDRHSVFADGDAAKRFIEQHYLPLNAAVYVGEGHMPPAWFTVATAWETAYTVFNFQSTAHKCYFVQDYEPWFFAASGQSSAAERTYSFGFMGLTAGGWLAEKLHREYAMPTVAIGFSYDRGRYAPLPRAQTDAPQQIFFYGRPSTPRRGFELGVLTLAEVVKRKPGTRVVIAGCDTSIYNIPFEHVNPGILALDDLPRLYSDCDAALVLSFSNLSLLPLELMASGCPVVSNNGPNVEWLLNDEVAVLCQPTIEALADGLVALLDDEEHRARLIQNGLALAQSTDWEVHARTVSDALLALEPAALSARGTA